MEEWELSKENVQPHKKGRDVQVLNASVQASPNQLEEQRRKLILEAESYTGDDPLHPWLRLVKWGKQAYATGGHQPALLALLESCARRFKADERYKSDRRYLRVWVQYADCCSDPADIFKFLEANEIGHEHALYYEAYATFCESRKNFSRANEVYQLGVARGAEPIGRLQNMYKSFLDRMDRRHKRQLLEEERQGDDISGLSQPRAFGQKLTGRGPRPLIQQQGRHVVQKSPMQRPGNASLQVFVDPEFGESSSRLTASQMPATWKNLGTDAERKKENVPRAMKWTEAKIAMHGKAGSQPSMNIFVDEEFERSREPPKNLKVPPSLRLRHDDIGGKKEETLRINPLQRFSESAGYIDEKMVAREGTSQVSLSPHAFGSGTIAGYSLSIVTADGFDRSFEEARLKEWRQGHEKSASDHSSLSPASVHSLGQVNKNVAVLDWLNRSPVIQLADAANQGRGGGSQHHPKGPSEHNAEQPSPRRIASSSMVERKPPPHGDETMAIKRIAQEAISLGVDPEVGNNEAVRHIGLVDPTITTKEAIDDIISMFQCDLPHEKKRRSDKPNKAFGGQNFGRGNLKDATQGFQIYMDDELGRPGSARLSRNVKTSKPAGIPVFAGEELPRSLNFGEDTRECKGVDNKAGLQIYVDDDLREGYSAKPSQSMKTGVSGCFDVSAGENLPRSLNFGEDTTEYFVYRDENSTDLTEAPTRRNSLSAADSGKVMVRQDLCDPAASIANSFSNLEIQSDKENRAYLFSPHRASGKDVVKLLNPWDENLLLGLLDALKTPLSEFEEYYLSSDNYCGIPLASLKKNPQGKTVELQGRAYYIKECTGQGAFAQVYLADDYEGDEEVVLKVQKPCCPWEFYIYSQVNMRIPAKERESFGHAIRMHCFSDYSVMVCKYGEHGTLQDVINAYLTKGEKMDETLCIFYTIEMLRMLESLHAVGLIHGDFKPDNLLIRNHSERFQDWSPERPGCWQHEGLCLIDWGRSVDLSLLPPGTQFLADCKTEAFQCIEMLEERPWTFQIDTYGLCVVAHCLLHGSYLEVKKSSDPSLRYQPKAAYKRYWNVALWKNLFDTLLNIDSCEANPPLRPIRQTFEDYLSTHPAMVSKLSQLLMRQNILMSGR